MDEYGAQPVQGKKEAIGIGGWLIFFQVWMYIFILVYLSRIEELSSRIPYSMSLTSILSITVYIAMLLLAVFCMERFYKGRSSFRILYMVFWGFILLFEIIPAIIVNRGFDWFFEAVFPCIGTFFVIALITSKRVKSTFVRVEKR